MVSEYLGYRRSNGLSGIRNHVAVIAADALSNPLAHRIAACVSGCVPVTQPFGRGQLGEDLAQTRRTLVGLGANPNVAAVLVVSQDESIGQAIANPIAASGKSVELIVVGQLGSTITATAMGMRAAANLAVAASDLSRAPHTLGELTIGVKCGLSDSTSGLVANRVLGMVVDRVVAAGGTAVFSEPAELIGAEHMLARRAVSAEVGAALAATVHSYEEAAARRGSNVSEGVLGPENRAGGLSTLEEKALGSLVKSGTAPIQGVIRYAERPPGPGLWLMDSPMFAPELMSGMAGAGVTAILFSTAAGNPLGFPLMPVIKVAARPGSYPDSADHVDLTVETVFRGEERLEQAADRLLASLLRHASGRLTRSEVLQENSISISRSAPSL